MSGVWEVKAGAHFWRTLEPLKRKYPHREFVEIVNTVKDCIRELQEKGSVSECGWNEHVLERSPFDDGRHFEFHIHDDDVLVVYFKRVGRRTIRMVGVYDHESIPG